VSRIGRLPIDIPNGVQVNLNGSNVIVKGPKGEMQRVFSSLIGINLENNQLSFTRNSEEPAERALHGTTRAVLANMIHGVSKGFQVILEVEGVGYRAEMDGKNLALHVGYSHPVKM
jgi:large subunit ribosomal protein L6